MPKLSEIQYILPESLQKFVGVQVGKEARMVAARGMLPLPPKDLVSVLYALAQDLDKEVGDAAQKTLLKMPENILKGILSDMAIHPLLLNFMSKNLSPDSVLQEAIRCRHCAG